MSDDQTRTVAFLSSPDAFDGTGAAEVVETHGAYVFLYGDTALKLKRAVRYDYMDLSTVKKRRAMLRRELELNRPVAPEIYHDIVPVVRRADDALTLGGDGKIVDWVLRMSRFRAEDELVNVARKGGIDDRLAARIGTELAAYHAAAPERPQPGAPLMGDILDELDRVFSGFHDLDAGLGIANWLATTRQMLTRIAPLLDQRGATGHVRRGHGDLHLRNIVLLDDRPVPFDALEFDETLGTCDLLYDLAFLLMDLCHAGLPGAACRVLDAWLTAFGGDEDSGLAALPLFLSVRAAIRAMVLLQTDAARGAPGESAPEVSKYLRMAKAVLSLSAPVLIAVGGFSGTGKSVFARGLSPGLGAAPGAVILSSDAIRKAGRDLDTHLAAKDYTTEARRHVYDRMFARARVILRAGHSVILDATFLDPALRCRAADIADACDVPFTGFWLDAPQEVLLRRIRDRRGDPSDADETVLRAQLRRDAGAIDWGRIDAARDRSAVIADGRARLGLAP